MDTIFGDEPLSPIVTAESIVLALILSVLILLLIRFLSLYERRPLTLLAIVAVWGALVAAPVAFVGNRIVNALLNYTSPEVATVFGTAIDAPLVEEMSKGIALMILFVVSYLVARRFGVLVFNGVTDGIVYGAAVGLGFAFAENIVYLFRGTVDGDLEISLMTYLGRVLVPNMLLSPHVVYSGIFGAGLGLAVWGRSWGAKILFLLLGLGTAMLGHSIQDGLLTGVLLTARFGLQDVAASFEAGNLEAMGTMAAVAEVLTVASYFVFAAAFFLALRLWVRYQRRLIREELAEEMEAGLISEEEEDLVPRYRQRSRLYRRLLRSGKLERWRALRRLHQEMVNLALLKRRLKRTGEDDRGRVERIRQRIKALKSQEVVELVADAADTPAGEPRDHRWPSVVEREER